MDNKIDEKQQDSAKPQSTEQSVETLRQEVVALQLQIRELKTNLKQCQSENAELKAGNDLYRSQEQRVKDILQNTESFYRALIQKAPDGVVLISMTGDFLFASPSARRMFGFAEDETITIHANDNTHPDDLPMVLETIYDIIANPDNTHTLQYRFKHKNGSWYWVESTFSNLLDEPGGNGIVINFRDISERKAVELALMESEKKYRLLIETMSEGVVYVDNDDVIQYVNQSCCDIYGYKADDLLGKVGYLYTVHEDDRDIIKAKNKSRLNGKIDTYEVRGKKLTGETIWLKISGAPVRDKENRVIGSVGIMSDITAQKSLEAQLMAAQKMEAIGQLAGGIAHDFNNLLTVILGYSEELIEKLTPENPFYKDAEEIFKAGIRATGLTQQLLTFSRKQVIQPRVLDINQIVTNLRSMLLRLIGEHIDIVTVLEKDIPPVKADPGQIEQVIVNLMVNSRDAMPMGGKIIIETSSIIMDSANIVNHLHIKPGQYTMLTISDNGCGIDKKIQSRIFDPFFTTKDKSKGLGMGLSTVYGIVKQSQGFIDVYSEPGQGTTVKILLPVTGEAYIEDEEIVLENNLTGNGEKILVVEDEESLCLLIRKMVEHYGYQVSFFTHCTDALEAVRNGLKPDLVITDVVMPQMNGKELADRIRQIIPKQKVLFMSGFTDNAIVHHGVLDAGIPFIQKPFSAADLAAQIKRLLNESDPSQEKGASILMLDDDENLQVLLKRAASKRGHTFTWVDTFEAALEALSQNHFDVILVDLNLDGYSGVEALQDIRQAGFTLPAIVFSGALSQEDLEQLKPLNVVKTFEKSFDNLPVLLFVEESILSS